ncbi:MAG: fumarate reductase/succinate dehydrogenase flavoprotein domain protein [Frankiales bacterium]|nr:fumarate reductase/succinate dehydrogenase flavoprotein domain protein [Frankiales bacterium]
MPDLPSEHFVVMGVAGAGKSTVGRLLAHRLGIPYADADDFHSPAAIAKMQRGAALTDADREPWLERIGRWLASQDAAVVSCSALRRSYRDTVRSLAPSAFFVHLAGDQTVVTSRVQDRDDHFMPASLVGSQYTELEPLEPDEAGLTVDLTAAPEAIADTVLAELGRAAATGSGSGTLPYQRQLPVRSSYDVVVVGGGPAGIAAAVASARVGARTLLIEQNGYLGGNLTAGLVGPCMTSYSLDGSVQLIRGVFDELVLRMEQQGAAIHPSKVPAGSAYAGFIMFGHDKVTPFEPEAVKSVALQLCQEAGVDLLLHTFVPDVLVSDGTVSAVVCASKSGLELVPATVVVDCSADADVATRAGAAVVTGRSSDGLTQPMTLFFRVENVADEEVERYVHEHPEDARPYASLVTAGREAGRFPSPRRGVGMYKTLRPGVWRINPTRVLGQDGTDVTDLTAAEIEGRRQVDALLEFFRADLPGFADCRLLDTAATIGVRETRRIVGDHVLTLEDLQSGQHFEDTIALAGYPVDIHDPTGAGGGVDESYRTANAYCIPYRSLLPVGIDNVVVAGRCISATHEALAAIRVMPPSFAMGEAAGTAAALAVRAGIAPRQVDVTELKKQLVAQGAYLGEDVA